MEAGKAPEKVFTLAELRQHKDGKSLWIAIGDTVYDVSKFMEEVIRDSRCHHF